MSTNHKGTEIEVSALDAYIVLIRSANAISSHMNLHLIENKLSPGQFGVLEALYHLGTLSQHELAKKILSSKGNITMIIDNLEKQKLVKRCRDKNDRRLTSVILLPEGKSKMQKMMPNHIKKITKAMSILTPEELRTLKQLCKKLGLSIS